MIDGLRIASPCSASWERMEGDERVRHCAECSLNVYNFAEMTRDEVRLLLARSEGRVCARLYRRADGTVLTRDCPTGLRAIRRRASRAAAAAVAALLSLPAFGGARKSAVKIQGSDVKLTIEHAAKRQPAAFTGVVVINGDPVPGVVVTLRDEATGQIKTVITAEDGVFTFASLSDGSYRVDVTLAGLEPGTIEHLELKSGAVTHANIALRFPALMGEVITLVPEAPKNQALSTTFTQSFIDKLPF